MNNESEIKFKEKLRERHDVCKEHPFWRTLSNDFHVDCVDMLKSLMSTFVGYFTRDELNKCPHALLLYPIMHNMFGCILKAKIMPKYDNVTIMETKAFGNYVMCLQTALQIIHYYIDGIFDEESMLSYDPLFNYDE